MKNKIFKRILGGIVLFFAAALISGCTKSFCSVNDKACLYASYVQEKRETILTNAKNNSYMVPSDKFWNYIDAKVETAYTESLAGTASKKYAPDSYIELNKKYQTATEEEKTTLVSNETLKAVIYYAGYKADGSEDMWVNFTAWLDEANADPTMRAYVPTSAFLTYYKSQISSGVGQAVTCITPTSGYFGLNENTYVEGKTWGQAFTDYGFIEGLLVYPIGWLVYTFAMAFGATGTNATGQILSIFFVTLIVRFFIILASAGSSNTQTKMNDLTPQLELLKAKYPNSTTNKYEQQQLTTETMALYKKNNVHPFRQFGVLILQFPIFIAVWGALQGSAILTKGEVFGLSLATVTQTAMMANSSETPFAIILFILMAIAQFFATMLPTWMQKYHKNKVVGASTVKVSEDSTTNTMMKYMPIFMMVIVIVMGLQLPAAMGIYWFFGALISIFQTIITEIVQTMKKNKRPKNKGGKGGDNQTIDFTKHGSFKGQKRDKHMKLH